MSSTRNERLYTTHALMHEQNIKKVLMTEKKNQSSSNGSMNCPRLHL